MSVTITLTGVDVKRLVPAMKALEAEKQGPLTTRPGWTDWISDVIDRVQGGEETTVEVLSGSSITRLERAGWTVGARPEPWSVELDVCLSEAPDADKIGDLLDQLTDHGAVAALTDEGYSVRLTVGAVDAVSAVQEAKRVACDAAARVGLPAGPIVGVDATTDDRLEARFSSENPERERKS